MSIHKARPLADAIRFLVHGRDRACRRRPSGHAARHGRNRDGAVHAAPEVQSADPKWPDRDRFVQSNGHGSMLLYALLHLTGYAAHRS